jgi:predicted transcriptional regulator
MRTKSNECPQLTGQQCNNTVELTAEIVGAYVLKNALPASDLPDVIAPVHKALTNVGRPQGAADAAPPEPPVPINRTIRPDYMISLEDGRRYRSLKHHLAVRGLTPEQYRAKWRLRPDYPMVASNYSKTRSELAKALGLGQKGRSVAKRRRTAK